jgi:hypothetical protein
VGDPDIENGKAAGRGEEEEEKEEVRKAALEFMLSLSEAKPSMVRKQDGWVPVVVRGCLEGMGEFPDDQASVDSWLEADARSCPSSVTIN